MPKNAKNSKKSQKSSPASRGRIVLGNQLFIPAHTPKDLQNTPVFMAEDLGLCTYEKHHKQKIVLFLAAMRSYRDELTDRGVKVVYHELPEEPSTDEAYESKLEAFVAAHNLTELCTFEIEDKFFAERLKAFANQHGLTLRIDPSPMFLTPRPVFAEYLDKAKNKPFMGRFYQQQRRRLNILVTPDGSPTASVTNEPNADSAATPKWSYDEDNRQRVPADTQIPETPPAAATEHVRDLIPIVNQHFSDHPGELSEANWWLPTTRRQALAWLSTFLKQRFEDFGPYEDALSTRAPFLWHSALTPTLNLGLITPQEVIDKALAHARKHDTPINSVEGFIRQIIGWREFVRGVYQHFSEQQSTTNFFHHQRQLTDAWYDATTGIPHLDAVIRKTQRYGYAHHIERLMVVGNLMTLCEIHPHAAHRLSLIHI